MLLYMIRELSNGFAYPSWFIMLVTLSFIAFSCASNSFFETYGVKADAITYCVILSVIFIYFPVIGLLGFIYRKYEEKLYRKQLYSIVKEHFITLSTKYKELVYIGDYGETVYDKWYMELDRFIDNVIKKQKSKFTLSNDELRTKIIKIFDKIKNQDSNQK